MTSLKQQRAQALVIMKEKPMLYQMVLDICQSGRQECEYICDRVRATTRKQEKTNNLTSQSLPVWPEPTRKQWEIARDISKLFKASTGVMGRPPRDLTGATRGALYAIGPTGYVDPTSANHSTLWSCSCVCGRGLSANDRFIMTANEFGRRSDCGGKGAVLCTAKALGKAALGRKEAPAAEQASEAADHIMNNLTNTTKH
jgi:hypothetical protein